MVRTGEPILEELFAVVGEYAADELHVAAALAKQLGGGELQFVEAGRFGVGDRGAVVNGLDTGPVEGGPAHGARLAGGGDNGVFEKDVLDLAVCRTDGVHLGVSRDVGGEHNRVVLVRDHAVANGD